MHFSQVGPAVDLSAADEILAVLDAGLEINLWLCTDQERLQPQSPGQVERLIAFSAKISYRDRPVARHARGMDDW
jgi:hypothetical protein